MKKLMILLILLFALQAVATVSDGESIRQYFVCNGETTTFTFTFKCNSSDDVLVYDHIIATGVETLLVEDTTYTIAATGSSYLNGGVVTISPALESTSRVVIVRNIKKSQETSEGAMSARAAVLALDKLTRITQDLEDRNDRSIHLQESDASTFDMTIPTISDRISKILGFDSDGNLTVVEAVPTGSVAFSTIGTNIAEAATAQAERNLLTVSKETDVLQFGADGTDTTDDFTAIQAALDSGASVVHVPKGNYKVSAPLRVPAGVKFKGEGGSFGQKGTVIYPDLTVDWPTAFEHRGVIESKNYWWTSGSGEGDEPGFWHGGAVIDIQVDCDTDPLFATNPTFIPDFGVVIWTAGEESLIEGVWVDQTTRSGIFIGGLPAVMTVLASSSRDNGEYGFYMSNHPNGSFATGIDGNGGGRANAGSIRFFGPSCDNNTLGGMYADGIQMVECSGLKSEGQEPMILIAGSGTSNSRQRWSITGTRHDPSAAIAGDVISIEGTAKPQIFIGPGNFGDSDNLINDTVSSVVIPIVAQGFTIFYDFNQTWEVRGRTARMPGRVTFKSDRTGDSAELILAHPSEAEIITNLFAANANPEIFRTVGAGENVIWSVDGPSTGDDYKLYAYNGTTMIPVMNMSNTGSAPSVTIGLATAHKVAFHNNTPIIQQNSTSQTAATFAANSSGISNDTATWDGYTIGDIVAILQAYGMLVDP